MNYGSEPADQVIRYYLEGTEYALKLTGTAAKNFAVFAAAVLKDQKKTHGKTKLVRLLRENKPLKFFTVPYDRMREFSKEANKRGLLFVPIRDRANPDDIEIAILAEDAAKVNRVIDMMQLDVTGLRSVGSQLSVSETGERSKAAPGGGSHRLSEFAEQTGGLVGRQAVDAGGADVIDEVEQDMAGHELAPSSEQKTINTETGPVTFEMDESEDVFNMGFTPAPQKAESEPPFENSYASKENSPELSKPHAARELPKAARSEVERLRERGQRPSVRMELGEIKAMLFARKKEQAIVPQVRTPIKIRRGEPTL